MNIQSNNQAVLANMERNRKFTGPLQVQIQPKKWNLDWADSEDEVQARISGDDHDTIHADSVEIYGPDGIVVRYEKRVHTKAGEHFRPSITPSEIRSGCPDGTYNIPLARVDEYKAMGKTVQVFDGNACWYPHTY